MSRVIDRYLLREAAQSWLAVTGVLLIILVSNQLSRTLQRAAEQSLPQEIVMTLIGLSTITNLTVLMPVGLLLAIVLAFGRLYHESEMTAVQACGIGTLRLYLPVSVLATAAAVALAWLAFFGAPDAAQRAYTIQSAAVRKAQLADLAPGKFRSFGGAAVFYAQRADDKGALHDVFVERRVGNKIEAAVAERAENSVSRDGTVHTVTLYNGTRYDGVAGEPQFRITEFESHGIPVRLPGLAAPKDRRELMATWDLIGSADRRDQAQLSWRASAPIMAFVLALLARCPSAGCGRGRDATRGWGTRFSCTSSTSRCCRQARCGSSAAWRRRGLACGGFTSSWSPMPRYCCFATTRSVSSVERNTWWRHRDHSRSLPCTYGASLYGARHGRAHDARRAVRFHRPAG
jgi:lipopolysaccharide export system permease protein